jgi:hypothetical protein
VRLIPIALCSKCNSEMKVRQVVPDRERNVTVNIYECAQCSKLHYLAEQDGQLQPWRA